MKVSIKGFDVQMELKNKGIELEVRDTKGELLGYLVVTKSKLIWCKGRTHRKNGKFMSLTDFITMMENG